MPLTKSIFFVKIYVNRKNTEFTLLVYIYMLDKIFRH